MKTVRAHEIGGPEVLVYEDVPDPEPTVGEVLVGIHTTGVNYTDVSSRKGTNPPASLPWTPGREAAGVVLKIGEGVSNVKVGDRVAYAMYTGSYAEKAVVPARLLVPLPDNIDFDTAAATMLQAMTAHFLAYGITRLDPNDSVLVHAGAGGVGLLLIQMLKRLGVRVFTTVSTQEKAELAISAGADQTIDYTKEDFPTVIKEITDGIGVKVVYDAVGQTTFQNSVKSLGRRGYMVFYGQSSGPVTSIDSSILRGGSLFLTRPTLGDYTADREELLYRANEVLGWVASGELKLHISLRLPLREAAEAHRQLEGRRTTGKVLLVP
ncbi:MAG: NADPH:quinone reductase [Dehalococcoidia bacterium]|nr:NADPH:quinone reductase [Dehalococcoidia bacterium]